ncbi:class I SAM-dependent methyltransferase [Mycolicibacterium sediminis]|uniref:class I SAM-dependent methyltransferase n=1 Tax=Mycolicibacterium sediminis TaxID=1286180 RepID=UPI0013D8DBEC|nr:class I SAM-dependent methyltransferase [Mycolicibacterium sediminis]
MHDDRRRASSFGAAAAQYDRFRPTYPEDLIAGLVPGRGSTVLDVGAGTGIASKQLADAGADVVAVEPDPEMAAVAAAKGLTVDVATFEDWEPAGRTFDLVVFAQSFHWVEPGSALTKVAGLLTDGGRLALLWNRIVQVRPSLEDFDAAYAGIVDDWRRPSEGIERSERLSTLLDEAGFVNERQSYGEDLHYSTGDWIDMVTTYSAVLTLEADARELLRARLRECIGDGGVDATNDALAVVCPRR